MDDEGTKRIAQTHAEFVRPKNWKNQNWIRENLPAAIHTDVQSVVEQHQNALTSAVAASRASAAKQEEE